MVVDQSLWFTLMPCQTGVADRLRRHSGIRGIPQNDFGEEILQRAGNLETLAENCLFCLHFVRRIDETREPTGYRHSRGSIPFGEKAGDSDVTLE
jgi:hypothetical protein